MGLLATKRSSQKLPEEKVTSNTSRSEVTTMDQILLLQYRESSKPWRKSSNASGVSRRGFNEKDPRL
jgi:hypothetical protein